MTFSIIIPCYNTAVWLEECIESIIRQNYTDWEIILVNDGSTDNTEDILKHYEEKDSRIKVIRQENQGVSPSRNRAISEAEGDYLIFLDSDDFYKDENCLNRIEDCFHNENIDTVVFRYQTVMDNGNITEHLQYFDKMTGYIYTGEEYLQAVLSEKDIYQWFPWLYAFKRELWEKNNIQFNPEFWILEDMNILYQIILKAQRVKVLNSVIYQYRVRASSVSRILSAKSMKSMLNVCKATVNAINRADFDENLKKLLNSNILCVYFGILTENNRLKKSDRKEVFELLKENRNLMDYTIRKNSVFIRRMAHILGLHITSRLLFVRREWKIRKEYIQR